MYLLTAYSCTSAMSSGPVRLYAKSARCSRQDSKKREWPVENNTIFAHRRSFRLVPVTCSALAFIENSIAGAATNNRAHDTRPTDIIF